jgi:hypothetical protein
MIRTSVRRMIAVAVALLAIPGVALAAEAAVKAASCCSGCPLGCC